jgi:hypothetical protein
LRGGTERKGEKLRKMATRGAVVQLKRNKYNAEKIDIGKNKNFGRDSFDEFAGNEFFHEPFVRSKLESVLDDILSETDSLSDNNNSALSQSDFILLGDVRGSVKSSPNASRASGLVESIGFGSLRFLWVGLSI